MTRLRIALLLFCWMMPLSLQAETDGGLSWPDVSRLLRQRFAERSPHRLDAAAAEVQLSLDGGLRFDPVFTTEFSRNLDNQNSQLTSQVTQGSPFGTELSLQQSRSDLEASAFDRNIPNPTTRQTTTSLQLSQQLLRDGPLHGLAKDRAATAQLLYNQLTAREALADAMLAALNAYGALQEAHDLLDASRNSHARAERQHHAVTNLVASGFKAKADLLVSEAALLRADLALTGATQDLAAAQRALANALLQRPEDDPLEIRHEAPSAEFLANLEQVSWPADPPAVQLTGFAAEIAAAEADLAWRDDLPKLALSAIWGRREGTGGDPASRLYREVALSVSMPLVSAIARPTAARAGIKADAAQLEAAQARRKAAAQRQDLEARCRLGVASVANAERLHTLSVKTLDIETQKYADGKSTIGELSRVQSDAEQAALGVAKAHRLLIESRLAYARSAGTLTDIMP